MQPCATMWIYNGFHTRDHCLGTCLRFNVEGLPNNGPPPACTIAECLLCDETESGPLFQKVAARSRRRSGLLSQIARSCDEILLVDSHNHVPCSSFTSGRMRLSFLAPVLILGLLLYWIAGIYEFGLSTKMKRRCTTSYSSRSRLSFVAQVLILGLMFHWITGIHGFGLATTLNRRVSRNAATAPRKKRVAPAAVLVAGASRPLHAAARSICTFDATDFANTSQWPYTEKDMARMDGTEDARFYEQPRLVTHIDDDAIAALTDYYRREFQSVGNGKPLRILDLCSSWISHLPTDIEYDRVVGVGMNQQELQANPQLTEFVVQDLNAKPSLHQFADASFDVICNVVSVDYLTKPKEIFQEMHRLLRPGGVALISFSNRCFATKAVAIWLQEDDIGRLSIVGSYFHYSDRPWKRIEALDLKEKLEAPARPPLSQMFAQPAVGFAWMSSASAVAKTNQGDPMFVVKGIK